MLISYNWLQKYVTLPNVRNAAEVAEKLKLSTVEVEGMIEQGKDLENVVVGKVVSAEKHPNADKLKVCQVDVGEMITIVCGGSNVEAGMLVAVAKNGAKVRWHGEGEMIELKPTSIRGVESNGMICGADEIGLVERFPKKDEKEIVDLSSFEYRPGTPLAQALGLNDVIFEIDNKSLSNRPDLWGHYGLARELGALLSRDVIDYPVKSIKKGADIDLKVMVENASACPKYMAVAMSGVEVKESPLWLKQALVAIGVRPINIVVDATNYVMFDLGQPLHAFDAKVIGNEIIVRNAKAGEVLKTLDEKDRALSDQMLVIANKEKALAIAGVMGGVESGVTEMTTDIIIESANFDAASIRKTSTKLGLRTDASARFEKSLDPNMCEVALKRVVELIQELNPGAQVASSVVDIGKPVLFTGPLTIPVAIFEHKIGTAIPTKTIVAILTRLGFGVKEKKTEFVVTIPTWRATKDVSQAEDLIEEVVRMVGYDAIPASLPELPIVPPVHFELHSIIRIIQDVLAHECGFTESNNYSFISEKQILALGGNTGEYIQLDNPLSKEKPFMRRSLLPNLLENVVNNASVPSLRLFEIGKVFIQEDGGPRAGIQSDELLPRQDTWFTAVVSEKKNQEPFKEVRRVVERLADVLGVSFRIVADEKPLVHEHPTRAAKIMLGATTVGSLYEVHPMISERIGLENRVGVVELNLTTYNAEPKAQKSAYTPVSLYPSIKRDVAFVVEESVQHDQIAKKLARLSPLLVDVELFDVYRGTTLGAGYKSMAYHLTYNSHERTLTTEEVDAIQKKVEETLIASYKADIRK